MGHTQGQIHSLLFYIKSQVLLNQTFSSCFQAPNKSHAFMTLLSHITQILFPQPTNAITDQSFNIVDNFASILQIYQSYNFKKSAINTQFEMNLFFEEQNTIMDTYKVLDEYFEVQFDLGRLQLHYPNKKISELQEIVKNLIKNIVLDIQKELFTNKLIIHLKFTENYTSKMYKEFICLQKILDQKSKNTFFLYYKNQLEEINLISAKISKIPLLEPMKNHPLLQVTMDNLLYVYQQFMRYAQSKNMFLAPNAISTTALNNLTSKKVQVEEEDSTRIKAYEDQLLDTGYVQNIKGVYSMEELHVIYNCYIKMKGRINEVVYQIQGRNLKGCRFSEKVLVFKLENIKLIGLYEIYGSVFCQIDGLPLNWRQFKQIYGDIFVNWQQPILQKLIRTAIYKDPTVKQIKQIALKLTKSYLNRYEGFSMKPKLQKFQNISFRPNHPPKQNGMLSSIKNQMRKLLLVGSSNNSNSTNNSSGE